MKNIAVLLLILLSMKTYSQIDSVKLWTGAAPNVVENSIEETWEVKGVARVSGITEPMIYPFIPSNVSKDVPAVIICPGGGYGIVAIEHEGFKLAEWFNQRVIAAFVLKYRLPSDEFNDKKNAPLQDAQQAIAYVRKHAKEYNIDKNNIGIMGFSAGGHLAATASVQYVNPVIDEKSENVRPAFSILIYPVISFTDSLTHKGSRSSLLSPNITPELISHYSSEQNVTKDTPKAFLVHAKNDNAVPVGNSISYSNALKKNGVDCELYIMDEGGHGFGYKEDGKYNYWLDRLDDWVSNNIK